MKIFLFHNIKRNTFVNSYSHGNGVSKMIDNIRTNRKSLKMLESKLLNRNYICYFLKYNKTLNSNFVFCFNNIYSRIYSNLPMKYNKMEKNNNIYCLLVCSFWFYGISTFVGYLMPKPFLYR